MTQTGRRRETEPATETLFAAPLRSGKQFTTWTVVLTVSIRDNKTLSGNGGEDSTSYLLNYFQQLPSDLRRKRELLLNLLTTY